MGMTATADPPDTRRFTADEVWRMVEIGLLGEDWHEEDKTADNEANRQDQNDGGGQPARVAEAPAVEVHEGQTNPEAEGECDRFQVPQGMEPPPRQKLRLRPEAPGPRDE